MFMNEIERLVARALADSDLPEEKALPFLEEISERLSYVRRYLIHGGFIQDKDGKWCKGGDKIEVEIPTEECNPVIGELQWDFDQKQFFLKCGEDDYEVADFNFYLKNPCQPDICKDFKHN